MSLLSNYIPLADPSYVVKPRHLAYYEFGEKNNPDVIVCAHGLSRNGLDFEALARALAAKFRVICPDMAGRGNSDWLTNKLDYNYTLYVADMLALLTQLRISKASWIGTSMGGIIGMMIAAGYPALVGRLVLNDVGAVVSAAGLKRIMSYVGTSEIFTSKDAAIAYMKSILAPFGIATDAEWDYMFNASFTSTPDRHYVLRYDPGISQPLKAAPPGSANAITDIDLSAIWAAVKCPTLIMRGQNSDILSLETAARMCGSRNNVSMIEIPGAGHAPALINETQIRIVTDWLDNIPQY